MQRRVGRKGEPLARETAVGGELESLEPHARASNKRSRASSAHSAAGRALSSSSRRGRRLTGDAGQQSLDFGAELRVLRRCAEQRGDVERIRLGREDRRGGAAFRAGSSRSSNPRDSEASACISRAGRRRRRVASAGAHAPASRRSASGERRAGVLGRGMRPRRAPRRPPRSAASSSSTPVISTRSCAQRAASSAIGSTATMRPSSTVTRIAPLAPVSRGWRPCILPG